MFQRLQILVGKALMTARPTDPRHRGVRRAALLAGVSAIGVLVHGHPADAACLACAANTATSGAAAAAAAAAVGSAQQAASAGQQAITSLSRATQALQAAQAAQNAARSLALSAPSTVPNGLMPGGLQVAPGVGSNPSLWQNANLPTQSISGGLTTVTVLQTAPQAILNWSSFNIGRNTELYFNQSAGNSATGNTWVVLNRIIDPSALPSRILGAVVAEGAVYVINQNGIIFGGSGQVNVGSLIASTLGITDSQFLKGIVNPQAYDDVNRKAFDPSFANTSGSPSGAVVVMPGAQIQTTPPLSVTTGGGFVYLFGSNVTNGGSITTQDGQAILAAGDAVYISQSTDPNIRGVAINLGNGGRVTNAANALVSAPTGNVMLVGLNIEQAGALLASTSIDEAGSISLLAHDGIAVHSGTSGDSTANFVLPTRTGTVVLDQGSVTAVLPDEDGRTALDAQPQTQSVITAQGASVGVLGGATVVAPSGEVTLRASLDPVILFEQDNPTVTGLIATVPSAQDTGTVYLASGAVVDVSGLQNVPVAASQDAVEVHVTGNELRDSPLQRGGILNGADVWVNIHDLDEVAADRIYTNGGLLEVSGWLGLIARTVDQRLTTGGSVNISAAETILRPGAAINIAGGSLDHEAGDVPTTWLIGSDGRVYNINDAPADLSYVSINGGFTVDHSRWGISETYADPLLSTQIRQSAYLEGKNAGSLTVNGRIATEMDADVDADAVNGIYQRSAASMAHNGSLVVGAQTIGTLTVGDQNVVIAPSFAAPSDPFAGGLASIGVIKPLPSDDDTTLHLSADKLDEAHYGSITIVGDGVAGSVVDPGTGKTLPAGISLVDGATLAVANGGSISLQSGISVILGTITINGQLVAHGGSVTLTGDNRTSQPVPLAASEAVLGSGSGIDVTGVWTNDVLDPTKTTPALYDGGDVTINAASVQIARGARIDASGGGWLEASGTLKVDSNGLPLGTGGDITIITNRGVPTVVGGQPPTYPGLLVLDGTVRSTGLHGGGTLTLAAPAIQIGGADPRDGRILWFDPSFFSQSGFGGYRLIAYQGLTVAPGSDVEIHAETLIPTAALADIATGSSIGGATSLGAPRLYQQAAPVNLVLSADDPFTGDLVLGAGSQIDADPGASVSLHASNQLTIDGRVSAPGGTINLDLASLNLPGFGFAIPNYNPAQTLWIGADAQILAPGLVQTFVGAAGHPAFRLWNGGSVDINENATNAQYYPYGADVSFGEAVNLGNDSIGPTGSVVGLGGSVIDVSGASGAIADASRQGGLSAVVRAVPVATDAGSLEVNGAQGLFLDTTLKAHAGGPSAAGGSLTLEQTLFVANTFTAGNGYATPVGELILTQNAQSFVPAGLQPGDSLPADQQGVIHASADQIMDAGFDAVSLSAVNAVVFDGNVNLSVARSITLNTGAIGDTANAKVQVNLAAAYVDIGSGRLDQVAIRQNNPLASIPNATPFAGTAELTVDADLIDFESAITSGSTFTYKPNGMLANVTVDLPGFADMNFDSAGDIRLAPALVGNGGSIQTLGNITFTSAQIYPITSAPTSGVVGNSLPNGLIKISATGPASVITIAGNGDDVPPAPLSAGGQIQLIAPTINQGGVLRAPFGQITFGNSSSLGSTTTINLLPGSITSVSGNGLLVPYGGPLGDSQYIYGYNGTVNGEPGVPAPYTIAAPIQKQISLFGQSVNVSGATNDKAAAKIDESGGGDLYGFQFVSGTGGSVDVLNGVNTFAIIPSLGSAYAPRSPLVDSSSATDPTATPVNLKVGDQVYLSGFGNLAAGFYTLLPGHYALLPGAYELTVSTTGLTPSQVPADRQLATGAYEISGHQTVANTAIRDSLESEFIVTPGAVVRQQAQYDETTLTQFFEAQAAAAGTAAPRLPIDAGQIVLDAVKSINFAGAGDFSVPDGGRGGLADIVGTNIEVLGPGDTLTAGYTGISDSVITNIGAQSVLIGGVRTLTLITGLNNSVEPASISIGSAATNVEIGSHAVLTAPEIMVRAISSLVLDPGAVIDTTGAGTIADTFPVDPTTGLSSAPINLANGGVFLMASNAPSVTPIVMTGSATSILSIGAGARIDAGGSLALANQSNFSLDSTASFGAPSITIAAPVINIGGAGTAGIDLSNALLSILTQGDAAHGIAPAALLTLSAGQAIDILGAAQLGGVNPATGAPTLAKLALATPVIQGFGASGDTARITAGQLILSGTTTTSASGGTGQGALSLDATELTLGAGTMGFSGFSSLALNASAQVIGSGVGVYSTTGDLTVATPLVTGAAGADTTLSATGAVVFGFSLTAPAPQLTTVQSIGAHLTVSAATITQGTDISLPSGVINLNAASGVTLASGSTTDVSGALAPFFDVVRISPGGTVNLQATSGDVVLAAGATIDLSGGDLAALDRTQHPDVDMAASDPGSDAGTLNIVAVAGTAQLDGVLRTTVVAGFKGAQAALDLHAGDAGALLTALQGFSAKQALTLETGDIAVGSLTAGDVELSAATGNLTASGVIDASGTDGGTIRLTAGNILMVAGGAVLDAHATTSGGSPGSVFLGIGGTSTGLLTLASGSRIDVTGSGPNGGKVWLRAPRVGADGVAISANGVTVTGAREIDAEAVAVTDITSNPFVDQNLAAADAAAQAYMANASAIKGNIGSLASAANFHLMPGIEFDSTGDMTLLQSPSSTNTGIDLHSYRYDGEPMVLTLRAAGNITMNGSLSDGFEAPVASPDGNIFAIAQILPQGSRSATLRLTAGADLAAGDPDALMPAAAVPSGAGSVIFNDPHSDQSGFPIPSVLRTGTGDLELAAAANVTLTTPFGIYTAGTPSDDVAGFTTPARQFISSVLGPDQSFLGGPDENTSYDSTYPTALYPSYPEKGGNLTVKVQGDLSSSSVPAPTSRGVGFAGSEAIVNWLWTMETPVNGAIANGTAFINFGTYYQNFGGVDSFFAVDGPPSVAAFLGIGALGGGNVNVNVGGSLSNVDVVSPATLRAPAGATTMAGVVVTGGGDLSVTVAGVLGQSNIDVGRGVGVVRATEIGTPGTGTTGTGTDVNLMVGEGQVTAISDRDANLLVGDPTRAAAQVTLPLGLEGSSNGSPFVASRLPYGSFTSYTDTTAFNVMAMGGDVRLDGDYVPPILDVVADTGSIGSQMGIQNGTNKLLVVAPSPVAQVDLYAGKDIANTGVSMTGIMPSSSSTAFPYDYVATIFNFATVSNSTMPSDIVQPDDPRTVHVYALGSLNKFTLATSKQADIRAGLDIISPIFEIQNQRSTDVSVVQAGRDMVSCGPLVASNACTGFNIRVAGPGELEVEAGRNINIEALVLSGLNGRGDVEGISSIGNADNALLPPTGASISIGVGLGQKGPDVGAFISTYFDPANAGGVIQTYSDTLLAYMRNREDDPDLAIGQALADFRALPSQQQLPLVEQVYFAEIKAGGRAAAAGQGAGGVGYDRAYKAIETLFPGSTPGTPTTVYQGDLSVLQLGRIRTESGGDIDVLAPGGGVTLGIESQQPDFTGASNPADTARPGILTLRQGDVNIFTDGDVVVAQSRVFTELGGNILMFSDNGDLNAGKGKQTSITTAPPQFTVGPYGQVTKSPVTPQTGAGIATLIGVPGVKPGDVDLFAPHGTVDAGEGGIRVSGNFTVAALQVLNIANISVQGTSIGIPTAPPAPVGALTTASNTTGATQAEIAAPANPSSNNQTSVVIVEVVGYGGGSGDDSQPSDRPRDDKRSYDPNSAVQFVDFGQPAAAQGGDRRDR